MTHRLDVMNAMADVNRIARERDDLRIDLAKARQMLKDGENPSCGWGNSEELPPCGHCKACCEEMGRDLAKAKQHLKVCEDLGISITVRPGSDGKDHAFSNVRAIAAEEALAKARAWATGICSRDRTPDPLCRICNPLGRHLTAAEEALAKAQARVAELEAALRATWSDANDAKAALEADTQSQRALASDGTSALAAVRLAQRLVQRVRTGIVVEDLYALTEEVGAALDKAFGSGT